MPTHLQRKIRHGDEFRQREADLHRPLGIVFVRQRIAEIDQDAIAHVFGNEPAVVLDQLGAQR